MPKWDWKRRKRQLDALQFDDLGNREAPFFERLKLPRDTLQRAISGLLGRMVFPGDAQYDQDRRLWNPVFNSHPAVIIYCLTESDVRICLYLSWISGLSITVRAGGHSTAGYSSSSGILVDVSGLNDAWIDSDNPILKVGSGANCGKVAKVLDLDQAHVPYSECDSVCIGGFVQGGGYGLSSRTFGMSSDNVVSMRVMLADGSIVTASEKTNIDLWWAMRGGTGNNFGVLLTTDYALRRIGAVYGWMISWSLATATDRQKATAALILMQDNFFRTASPQFNIQASIFYRLVVDKVVPQLLVCGVYFGSPDEALLLLKPLIQSDGAELEVDTVGSYSTLSTQLLLPQPVWKNSGPQVQPFESKQTRYVARDLTLAEWRAMLDFLTNSPPNLWSYFYLEIYGGQINSYPVENSAFIHRNVAFNACLDVFWYPGDDPTPVQKFSKDWCDLLGPMWNGEVCQSYPNAGLADYRSNYWGGALDALVAVKAKYDPTDFFQFPQMVSPRPGCMASKPVTWPSKVALALARPIVRTHDSPWPASRPKV
jgi:FAD binding domain/Berberine and berberine like